MKKSSDPNITPYENEKPILNGTEDSSLGYSAQPKPEVEHVMHGAPRDESLAPPRSGLGVDSELFRGSRFETKAAVHANPALTDSLRRGLSEASDQTLRFVRARPYTSLAMAVGAGLLVGRFLKKGNIQ